MPIQEALDAERVVQRFIGRHNAAIESLDSIEADRAQLAALNQTQRDALVAAIDAQYGTGVGAEITAKYGSWQAVRTAARTTHGLTPFNRG